MAEELRLKKISALPIADGLTNQDVVLGVQDGITKRLPVGAFGAEVRRVKETHERLIFNKKFIAVLGATPEDNWIRTTYNERFYPQAFGLDEDANKLLIVGTGSTNKTVLVYDWPSMAFDRVFVCTGGTVTEGLVVRKEGSKKYLYLRTTGSKLGRYDITTYPENRGSISEDAILEVVCGLNFMERNGTWTILDTDNNSLGNLPSRGKFTRFDSDFNVLGSIDCGSFLMGVYAGQEGDTSVSKAQGVADTGYGLIASMGGQQVLANPSSNYGQNGLRVFTYDGNLVAEGMLDPKRYAAKMAQAWGLSPTLIENEGIIVNRAGDVFTLTAITDYHAPQHEAQRMIIVQEFCYDGDDFSDCAASRNAVMNPIGQKVTTATGPQFLGPINADPITTIVGLITAMRVSGLKQWWGYTTSIVLTNVAGEAYPAGCDLFVRMTRSDIFYITLKGFNRYMNWRVYLSNGNWIEEQVASSLFAQTYDVTGSTPGSVALKKLSSQALSVRMTNDSRQGIVPDWGSAATPFPNIYGGSCVLSATGATISRTDGGPTFVLSGPSANHKQIIFQTLGVTRWRLSADSSAESGNDSGTDFALAAYNDAGLYKNAPIIVSRASGETRLLGLASSGPVRPGQYTLSTLPSAAVYNGYEIDVTNATGGPKRCRSNGAVWQILNTTTTVS